MYKVGQLVTLVSTMYNSNGDKFSEGDGFEVAEVDTHLKLYKIRKLGSPKYLTSVHPSDVYKIK